MGRPLNRRVFLGRLLLGGLGLSLHRRVQAKVPSPPAPTGAAIRHIVAAGTPGRFLAWPANNGLWSWEGGREILVGFSEGPWVQKEGHQIGDPQSQHLLRTLDGGESWLRESPEPYVGREGDPLPLERPVRFDNPDLALRVAADGGRLPKRRLGRFFLSQDRGRQWQGPFTFDGLEQAPELDRLVLTSRTSYVAMGPSSLLVLLSARDPRLGRLSGRLDKTFVARSDDGGRHFRFAAWIVPWSDAYRAVMPSTVQLAPGRLLTVLRRRDPRAGEDRLCWLDAYSSIDGGTSWAFLSRVGETGLQNGNPGALVRLRDGRLACAYADRSRRALLLRLSADDGRSWGPEALVRSNPFSSDIGYPQMAQNHRGELVVIYYLARPERPHAYIEAALVPLG